MAEIRRGTSGDARGIERLPWLEPVEDEDDEGREGGGRLVLIGIGMLVAVALLVGGFLLARRWHASHEDIGGIIRAPTTPYKERPANPGGLNVTSSGMVAEQTGTGSDIDAPIALVVPEQPVVGPGAVARALAPVPAPRPAVAGASAPSAAKATPASAPMTGGGTIELGAFSTEEKARAAWKSLSKRFQILAPMTMEISPLDNGGATLYRLRASGGGSAVHLCAELQVAGESCGVVG